MTPKKILVPVDLSPASKAAAQQALDLALSFDADVTLFHVIEPPSIVTPDVVLVPPVEGVTYDEFAQQRAHEELRQFSHTLTRQEKFEPKIEARIGHARNAIVELSSGYDLVVMGTHGRTGLGRLLLGSVADYVVRHAACPVMTVRQPA